MKSCSTTQTASSHDDIALTLLLCAFNKVDFCITLFNLSHSWFRLFHLIKVKSTLFAVQWCNVRLKRFCKSQLLQLQCVTRFIIQKSKVQKILLPLPLFVKNEAWVYGFPRPLIFCLWPFLTVYAKWRLFYLVRLVLPKHIYWKMGAR